jgi:spore coat polysaccharide biosynthesis predicted glycosyltransferase SpsG
MTVVMSQPPGQTDAAGSAPTIFLQADGGGPIGFGHLGRCLAIWQELGGVAAFEEASDGVRAWLEDRGVRTAPRGTTAAVVLLDRVASVELADVAALQQAGARVCLLDDPGPGRAIADLVIDPPTAAMWPPASGRRLSGFKHALLRRDVREAAFSPLEGIGVLLSVGGSDPARLTPALSRALRTAGVLHTPVLGPGYAGPNVPGALRDPTDFARTLAGADLVVTGFGHTLLEAAHLGIPAVALAQRGSDRTDAAAFVRHGCAKWLDAPRDVDPRVLAGEIARLHADAPLRAELAARGRRLVDGRGAQRVADALRELV